MVHYDSRGLTTKPPSGGNNYGTDITMLCLTNLCNANRFKLIGIIYKPPLSGKNYGHNITLLC